MKSYISFDANEFYLEVSFGQSSDFKAEVRHRPRDCRKLFNCFMGSDLKQSGNRCGSVDAEMK